MAMRYIIFFFIHEEKLKFNAYTKHILHILDIWQVSETLKTRTRVSMRNIISVDRASGPTMVLVKR